MSEAVKTDKGRIATARRNLIICLVWLAVAPFGLWFALENRENFLISFVPGMIGILGIAPLLFSGAIVDEYKDAKNGVQSF